MQFFKRGLLLLGALVPFVAAAPLAQVAPVTDPIPNRYIVKLKDGIDAAQAESHRAWASSIHTSSIARRAVLDTTLKGIERILNINLFNGYIASFDDAIIDQIRASDDVCLCSNHSTCSQF